MIPRKFVIEMIRNPHKLHVIVAWNVDAQGYSLVLFVDNTLQLSSSVGLVKPTAEQIIAYAHGLFAGSLGMLADDAEYTEQVKEFWKLIQEVLGAFPGAGIVHTYNYPNLVFVPAMRLP